MLCGTLEPETARLLTDNSGLSLEDVRRKAGMQGNLESVRLPHDCYSAFVELHIEQGPLLERAQVPLGIVESIAAPASLQVVIEGEGGHAGAVLMPDRKDALCAAAEIILAIEDAARSSGSQDTVATVGMCEVFPGAVNSIPTRVRLSLDARDTDLAWRDRVLQAIQSKSKDISRKRGVTVRFEVLNADTPASCSPKIMDALAEACRKHAMPFQKLVSRAYHDSLFMSRVAPTGMLFIPCRGGISHRPDEFASPEDIARGTLVLAEVLSLLAGGAY
jgi:N-carbamoyl-L-amino-acid hydrolase